MALFEPIDEHEPPSSVEAEIDDEVVFVEGWETNQAENPMDVIVYKDSDETYWVFASTAYRRHIPRSFKTAEAAHEYAASWMDEQEDSETLSE